MNTYFISFCKGKNLGVCIVDAVDVRSAIDRTLELEINPGGEAMIFQMPTDESGTEEINLLGKNRLISSEEMKKLGYLKMSETPEDFQDYTNNHPAVSFVCDKHNKQ